MSEFCTIKTKEIVNGEYLMSGNTSLVTWDSDLDALENGKGMFYNCTALASFKAKTPNLKNCEGMFVGVAAEVNAPSNGVSIQMNFNQIENGNRMFLRGNGSALLNLISETPIRSCFEFTNLKTGVNMFSNRTVKLYGDEESVENDSYEQFMYAGFPSLVHAAGMFYGVNCPGGFSLDYSVNQPQVNFSKTINFYNMFALSAITDFVHNNLCDCQVNLSDWYNDSHTDFEQGYMYLTSGCNVGMNGMFSGSNVSTAYLDLSSNSQGITGIDCTNMFINADLLEYCYIGNKLFSKIKNANSMFYDCGSSRPSWHLVKAGLYHGEILDGQMIENAEYMFSSSTIDEIFEIRLGDNLKSMKYFASGCSELGRVTGLYSYLSSGGEFFSCDKLTYVQWFIGGGSVNFYETFINCPLLETVNIGDSTSSAERIYDGSDNNGFSCYGMFANCSKLTNVVFDDDCSFEKCKNSQLMFKDCVKLKYNAISSIVGSFRDVQKADRMCYNCEALEKFPMKGQNFVNLESASEMFCECDNMVGNFWDFMEGVQSMSFNSLKNTSHMFRGCSNMYGNWYLRLPEVTDASFMFSTSGINIFAPYGEVDFSMPKLKNGEYMFNYSSLSMFNSETPLLENGDFMFCCCDELNSFQGNLNSLKNGIHMFDKCNLTSFTTPLPALTTGDSMFNYCSSLYHFEVDLPSLTSGDEMFSGCNLTGDSVRRILNSIPQYTNGSHTLTLGMCDDGCDVFGEITGFEGTITNIPTLAITYKGWNIEVMTNITGGYEVSQPSPLSIVEGSQYIPDASTWNDAFASSGIVVTSVHDGYAWN